MALDTTNLEQALTTLTSMTDKALGDCETKKSDLSTQINNIAVKKDELSVLLELDSADLALLSHYTQMLSTILAHGKALSDIQKAQILESTEELKSKMIAAKQAAVDTLIEDYDAQISGINQLSEKYDVICEKITQLKIDEIAKVAMLNEAKAKFEDLSTNFDAAMNELGSLVEPVANFEA